jgi:hypothetical protein
MIEDQQDTGVVEASDDLDFRRERFVKLGLTRPKRGQDLDRDVETLATVSGSIDATHSPLPEHVEKVEGAEMNTAGQH